jgi:hypothetical protein
VTDPAIANAVLSGRWKDLDFVHIDLMCLFCQT